MKGWSRRNMSKPIIDNATNSPDECGHESVCRAWTYRLPTWHHCCKDCPGVKKRLFRKPKNRKGNLEWLIHGLLWLLLLFGCLWALENVAHAQYTSPGHVAIESGEVSKGFVAYEKLVEESFQFNKLLAGCDEQLNCNKSRGRFDAKEYKKLKELAREFAESKD
jgi:hypothetical protein